MEVNMIEENINKILTEIKDYNTKLICVSKTKTCDEIMGAYKIGIRVNSRVFFAVVRAGFNDARSDHLGSV